MAIKDDDLLYVQRPTGVDAGGYKITAGDLLSGAGGGGSSVTVDETAPLNPAEGDLWWADSDVTEGGGRLYVWTGDEWVDTSLPGGGSGAAGEFLSKTDDDTAAGKITFDAGLHSGGQASASSRPAGVSIEETGVVVASRASGSSLFVGFAEGVDNATSSIKSDGNAYFKGPVGVGTDAPLQLLHVEGDSDPQIKVSANGTSAGLNIENQGQRNWQIWADRDADQLRIGHDSRNTAVVSLTTTNFGVNTDLPTERFQVDGNSHLNGTVWMGSHKNNFPGNGNNLPGCHVESAVGGASIHLSRTDNTPLFLNTNIDTAIVRFKKGGTEKGTITIDDNGIDFSGKHQGLYADQFLRSDADDDATGRITFNSGTGHFGSDPGGGKGAIEVTQADSNADAFMAFHISNKMAGYFGLDAGTSDLFWGGWSVGNVRHRVAHGGNLDHFPVVRTDGANQTVNGEKTFNNNIFFTNGRGFFDQGLNIGTRNTGAFPGVDNIDVGGRLHNSPDSGCFVAFSRSDGEPLVTNRTGTNGNVISVRKNGAAKGGIEVNDSNIIITGQASDYRIKKDITPMPSAVEDIKAMRLINFVYTDRGHGETHEGFIAHELQEIVPGAVTRHKDAVDEDGKPDLQGIDYSKLIPKLTKALQEALERIEILEEKLNGTT